MRSPFHGRARLLALGVASVMAIAACGSSSGDGASEDATTTAAAATTVVATATTAASAATTAGATTTANAKAAYDAAMTKLVADAKAEGKLTVYGSQSQAALDNMAKEFKAQYGIEVTVARMVDADMIAKLDTEISTGATGADFATATALAWLTDNAAKGNFLDAKAAPSVAGLGEYNAKDFVHEGNYFETGAAVLTFAWNTEALPGGLKSMTDIPGNAALAGKVAVIDPGSSATIVDFYRWAEENFGADYTQKIAAMKPRIYPSALPIGEALISGEVAAAIYAAPTQLQPAKDKGAPVNYAIDPKGAWGAKYFSFIPKSAKNKAAAALFAEFYLTKKGQELAHGFAGTVLADVPNSLITNDKVRKQDLSKMNAESVAEYTKTWNALFKG